MRKIKYTECQVFLDCEKNQYVAIDVRHYEDCKPYSHVNNKYYNFTLLRGHIKEGQTVGKQTMKGSPYPVGYCRLFKKYVMPEKKREFPC